MSVYSKYMRERQRVQDIVKKLESKGYYFNEDVLPQVPKKITQASVRKLEKITLKHVYNKANIVFEGGDYKRGREAIRLELNTKKEIKRQYVMERVHYYETIYDNFINGIRRTPSPVFKALSNIMEQFEAQLGKERVAMALEEMPESFHQILAQHRYDSEASVSDFTTRLLAYVPELGRLEREQLAEVIEENESYIEPE